MARLLSWPINLGKVSYQRMSGPRATGSVQTESIGGFVQTTASAFGLWVYQFGLHAMNARKARLWRQMITALHGGANAVRVPLNDPDVMTFREAGVDIDEGQVSAGVPFSNGQPCSNGKNLGIAKPPVAVAVDAAKGDTIVSLALEHWGHTIEAGWIGFFPFHLAKYEITEVIEPGQYRVWPPLRAALEAGRHYATLYPVVAMRLQGESAGTVQRGLVVAESNSMTLLEVPDDVVRKYFTD